MSAWGEPRRWHESDLPPDARAVLESAVLDDPSSERVARVEARLAGALGWPSGGQTAPGSSAPAGATSTGLAAKTVVGVIVAAGAVGLGAWLASERAEIPRGTPRERPTAEPLETERADEPSPDPEVVVVPAPSSDPAPEDPSHEARRPRATSAVAPQPPPDEPGLPHPTISTLAQELRLVDAARAALATSPERALVLADDHRTSFPQGTLTPERELITVEALLALDRPTEATGRAATLRRDYPTSPAAHRAARLITEHASAQ